MTETRATLRRRGSNLVAIIPPAALKAEGLYEGDEVLLAIRKAGVPRDAFGMLSGRPLQAAKIVNAIRRDDAE